MMRDLNQRVNMKIVSWNVNGLRSLKKKIGVIITELEADVACFQETKITKELMTEELAIVDGYRSYFSYSRARAGYSGVVIYCRRGLQPEHATDSLITKLDSEDDLSFSLPADTLKCLDNEGRTLIAQFRLQDEGKEKSLLTLINLYCPCVTGETEGRELFRLQFLQTLEERIKQLQKISYVIVLGDINISHKVIDSCDPGDTEEFLSQPHRQWLDKMLTPGPGALIDTYRVLHPCTKYAYTCWNTKLNARQTNFGTRIDYILLDSRLREHLKSAEVMAKYMGSDHCPVQAEITNINVKPSVKPPPLCSSYRFKAKQQKLTMFMTNANKKSHDDMFNSIPLSETGTNPPEKKRKPAKNQSLANFLIKEKNEVKQENESQEEPLSQSQLSDSSQSDSVIGGEKSQSQEWSKLFSKKSVPKCLTHQETCVLQTVKKVGKNKGKKFYSCARPVGLANDKQARCSYFLWADEVS